MSGITKKERLKRIQRLPDHLLSALVEDMKLDIIYEAHLWEDIDGVDSNYWSDGPEFTSSKIDVVIFSRSTYVEGAVNSIYTSLNESDSILKTSMKFDIDIDIDVLSALIVASSVRLQHFQEERSPNEHLFCIGEIKEPIRYRLDSDQKEVLELTRKSLVDMLEL